MIVEGLAALSNCQKRVTVCILYDKECRLAGFGYNRCAPPTSGCARLTLSQSKSNYTGDECETIHAEIMALRSIHPKRPPVAAVVYGHEFACPPCEKALRDAGILHIEIVLEGYGTGLKKKSPDARNLGSEQDT